MWKKFRLFAFLLLTILVIGVFPVIFEARATQNSPIETFPNQFQRSVEQPASQINSGKPKSTIEDSSVLAASPFCSIFLPNSDIDGGLNGCVPEQAEIFYVNGICTSPIDHRNGIHDIENTFLQPVMGIYNLTAGALCWQDFTESVSMEFRVLLNNTDSTNAAVRQLIRQIEWHFATNVSPNLTIIAHSQGALITSLALNTLQQGDKVNFPNYRNKIQVITLGGASFSFPIGPTYHHYINFSPNVFDWPFTDPIAGNFGVIVNPLTPVSEMELRFNSRNEIQSKCGNDGASLIRHSVCLYMVNIRSTYWSSWGIVGGKVLSTSGSPIEGASVSASLGGSVDTTDRDGVYQLWGVPPGFATITASNNNYGSNTSVVNVIDHASQQAPTIYLGQTICSGGSTSGNCNSNDITPPTGTWTSPPNNATLNSQTVFLNVSATDNAGGSGVREVRFSGKWNNAWHDIGIDNTPPSPYVVNWDMCGSGVPDGDIELGMEVWDNANNKWVYSQNGHNNIHITKHFDCGSGASTQVQMCTTDNFGNCQSFDPGVYLSMPGNIGNDTVRSSRVPSGYSLFVFGDDKLFNISDCATGDRLWGDQSPWDLRGHISSFIITTQGSCDSSAWLSIPAVLLFENTSFNGPRMGFGYDPVFMNIPDKNGYYNDKIDSVHVPTGLSVILYRDNNREGGQATSCLTGNVSDLGGFNHTASAIDIFTNTNCQPQVPSNLRTSGVSDTSINLAWDDVPNETRYTVYKWGYNGTAWDFYPLGTTANNVNQTTYTDSGLSCNTDYFYLLTASSYISESDKTGFITVHTNACPFATPSNLSAIGVTQNRISLSWVNNAPNASEVRIERSLNGLNGWSEIAAVSSANSFADLNLLCATTYYYRVRAYRSSDNAYTSYSNTASSSTNACDPLAPGGLVAQDNSSGNSYSVFLSWAASPSGPQNIDGYKIIRTSPYKEYTVDSNTTWFIETDLTCGTDYTYSVASYRGGTISPPSNFAFATTAACPPPVGTWSVTFYEGTARFNDPNNSDNQRCTITVDGPQLDHDYGLQPPCDNMTGDYWVADHSATIHFDDGNYIFEVKHDDGMKFWVNNQLMLDDPDYNYWSKLCPAVHLSGDQNLHMLLMEAEGASSVGIIWYPDEGQCNETPTNLQVSGVTSDSLTLTWDDVGGETGYNVFKWGILNGVLEFHYLTTLAADTTTFTDTGLYCDFEYFYRITSFNDGGESAPSDWVKGKTLTCPSPPNAAPSRNYFTDSSVTLSWSPLSWAAGYQIQWTADPSFFAPNWYYPEPGTSSITIDNLSDGVYYWRIRALQADGTPGAWSAIESFTVDLP